MTNPALERCIDCRKWISIEAQSCPKCGKPLELDWYKLARSERHDKRERATEDAEVVGSKVFSWVIILACIGTLIGIVFPDY